MRPAALADWRLEVTTGGTNPQALHEAAWPDMFANLQAAYAELTNTELKLERPSKINL